MADLAAPPDCARYSLRGEADMLAAGCAAFGLAVPAPLRATRAGERAALWLGPDEVLLLAPAGTPRPAAGLAVDVSGRQVALEVAGRAGETMLAAGCPLDIERMAVGGCTRTLFYKADIILWRHAPFAWRLEVWRSFAPYVRALLSQAARDWPVDERAA
jgi:sarcosine oxidase subunit gamma